MLAIVAPTNIAKPLIVIVFFLISTRLLIINNIFLSFSRIIILALLIPGITLTAINSPQDLVRFSVILILLFGFPFTNFTFDKNLILKFSFLILIYLIFTQIFISFSVDWLISLRNTLYYHEYSYIFDSQNFIYLDENGSLLKVIGKYRLGGIYYNPNVLGLIVLLYFLIFDACYAKLEKKKKLIFLFTIFITLISLLLTYSRTAIVGFLIYLFLKNISIKKLLFLRVNFFFILVLLLTILIGYYNFSHFLEGLSSSGSVGIKFKILTDYIKSTDLMSILFGGQHDTNYKVYDSDLGNWIGAVGFIGILGIIMLFIRIININNNTLPLIIALTFMSIGNTTLYGLLTANVVLCYFLIVSDKSKMITKLKN